MTTHEEKLEKIAELFAKHRELTDQLETTEDKDALMTQINATMAEIEAVRDSI